MNRAVWFNVSPEGAKAIGTLHHFVTQGTGLPSLLTHLVFLRVSQINGCAHCIDIHTRDLLAEGMSVEKVVLVPVWHEAAYLFSEQERAGTEHPRRRRSVLLPNHAAPLVRHPRHRSAQTGETQRPSRRARAIRFVLPAELA